MVCEQIYQHPQSEAAHETDSWEETVHVSRQARHPSYPFESSASGEGAAEHLVDSLCCCQCSVG